MFGLTDNGLGDLIGRAEASSLVLVGVDEAVLAVGVQHVPDGVRLYAVLGCQGIQLQTVRPMVVQDFDAVRDCHALILRQLFIFTGRDNLWSLLAAQNLLWLLL